MKNFITPAELRALQTSGKQPVIIDARGDGAYEAGHIAGALPVDLERDLTKPAEEHGGRHPLPDMDAFAKRMAMLGVTADRPVVIYDDWMSAVGRLWWMLRYAGVASVKVLAGGIRRWHSEGYPLTTEPTALPEPAAFTPVWQTDWLVSRDEVVALTQSKAKCLVDVRAPERYRGETEPLDKVAGHIPTAINLYYEEPYTADGPKPADELRRVFRPLYEAKKDIVVYCGSGITAPIALLAIDEMDIPASLYLGSFSDWISYDDAKIAVGTEEP